MPSLCSNCPTKARLSSLLWDLEQKTTAANVHTLAQAKQSVGSMLEFTCEAESMCTMCERIATKAKETLEGKKCLSQDMTNGNQKTEP